MIEAIRYGERSEVRARLEQVVDNAVDRERVRELLEARSLVSESMDISQIMRVREDMERYAARRLQPHYIKSFFVQAFEALGGSLREREPGRYRISYVPARIRNHAKQLGTVIPVWEKYDRICFDKEFINPSGLTDADFVCPGHPLLDTVISLTLDKKKEMLRSGTVLVDPTDPRKSPRGLFFLEQDIKDARATQKGDQRVISREVHFVEFNEDGSVRGGGSAPYLDYRPATAEELEDVKSELNADWLSGDELESQVLAYAIESLVPRHLERIRGYREALIDKTKAAVHQRLTKEINYWDLRATELRQQEKSGKPNVRINAERAHQRADEMAARLERRTHELELERQISATPPVVIGGAIVVPIGMILGERTPPDILDTRITEQIAMQAVIQAETKLGNHPKDVSQDKIGYDIESFDPKSGRLRFIEVKGRKAGADTVTVYHTEILNGLNAKEQFILALVEVENGQPAEPRYVFNPFTREPDPGAVSVNYNLKKLLSKSQQPQ